ncbi:MAG TPA: hypothetical protein VIJ05_09765, partial [Actinomycetes bacterium]
MARAPGQAGGGQIGPEGDRRAVDLRGGRQVAIFAGAAAAKATRFPNHAQILATCSFWRRTQRSNGHGTSPVEPGRGDASMQAVRLHKYNERPTVDEIEEPKVEGPHDVIVKVGGAG